MNKKENIENISILFVDYDRNILSSFLKANTFRGISKFTAESCKDALNILSEENIDVIIAETEMPDIEGIEFLKILKGEHPNVNVIIMTGYGFVEDAVKAIKYGASDYIAKPFKTNELLSKVKNICKKTKRKKTSKNSIKKTHHNSFPIVIAKTNGMKDVLKEVEIVASTDKSVLITGETGVGKDIIARLIHRKSKRKNQPFVRINCAELDEEFIERELFGHEKIAFTGTVIRKKGKIELADNGTIFLDDVENIPVNLQRRLLIALVEKKIIHLGGTENIDTDVRVIAATNKNYFNSREKNGFRSELFHQLNTEVIAIPPLRERKGDIIPLAKHFLREFSHNGNTIKLTKKIKDMLLSCKWPGNVRELRSTIERIEIYSGNGDFNAKKIFSKCDLTEEVEATFMIESPSLTHEDVVKSLILKVLKKANWNIQQTASVLNLNRNTLKEKIEKYKLNTFEERDTENLSPQRSQRKH